MNLSRRKRAFGMRGTLLILLSAAAASAFENREAKEDAAALQVDGYFGLPGRGDSISADVPFYRAYGYSFFPLANISGRDLLASAEFSLLPRRFRSHGSPLNGPMLQSYGLGLGFETVHTESQAGFAYAMAGVNGDMRGIGPRDIYGDLSYTHQFNLTGRLMAGGGIDFHFYFGDYFPYPVVLLDWRIAEHTKLKINFDTGELKQFLTDYLSVSVGAQYDIFHYGFGRRRGYAMETTGAMLRWEYRIGANIYARLSLKKPFWGEEKTWTPAGMSALDAEGESVRMQVAYGM